MIAIGSFAPQSSDFYSRMIIRPKTTAPAPTPTTTTTTAPPPRGIPTPPPPTPTPISTVAPYTPPVILDTHLGDNLGGTTTTTTTAPTSTGPTTGAQTGSTGSSDFSRLIDLIGSQYAAQDVNGNLAPVSFASESTGTDAAAPAGNNSMAAIIVAVVVIAGVYLYMKRKRKA